MDATAAQELALRHYQDFKARFRRGLERILAHRGKPKCIPSSPRRKIQRAAALHKPATDLIHVAEFREVDSAVCCRGEFTAQHFQLRVYINFVILCLGSRNMPKTHVAFYREADGEVLCWPCYRNSWGRMNGRGRIAAPGLSFWGNSGMSCGGSAADYLRDEIYELRAKQGHVQYRMLYFFHGREVVVLAHALTKEDEVPRTDIERAIKRMKLFRANPKAHTYESED